MRHSMLLIVHITQIYCRSYISPVTRIMQSSVNAHKPDFSFLRINLKLSEIVSIILFIRSNTETRRKCMKSSNKQV